MGKKHIPKHRGFNKARFPKSYQRAVGMSSKPRLHENSLELVSVIKQFNLLNSNNASVFEIGMGPGRNLHYILEEYPNITISGNDLYKDASFNWMSDEVKAKINFIEGDSEDVIFNNTLADLDLFMSSDHLMHLEYKKADKIIKEVSDKWKPKHIIIREIKKEHETPTHPRLYHDYDQLLQNYKLIDEVSSAQDSCYFIKTLKRKID